jgi:hypothetical protein
MLDQDTIDFYNNWHVKLSTNTGNEIHNVFDRYRDLFAIYNKLYKQIPKEFELIGRPVKGKVLDNRGATEMVVELLTGKAILDNLQANNCNDDIQDIIRLMEQQLFHIKLKDGEWQEDQDAIILENLKSSDSDVKATAMLQVVYLVRCNLVHGSKDYEQHQLLLLEPLTRILRSIIDHLYAELSK